MNLDTDFQYAFTSGVRDYMNEKKIIFHHKLETLKETIFQTKNIMTLEYGKEKEKKLSKIDSTKLFLI